MRRTDSVTGIKSIYYKYISSVSRTISNINTTLGDIKTKYDSISTDLLATANNLSASSIPTDMMNCSLLRNNFLKIKE